MEPDRTDPLLEELARLREEVVNTRNLTIKTDNHVQGLSSEVKAIARALGTTERKNLLNSFVAYILFVVLIAGGLWLTFQARTERNQVDHALFEKKESEYRERISELNAELGRWKQIERELLEFERLVKEGQKEQAVTAFNALRRVRFSGLLEDLVSRFKADVAKDTFDHGKQLFDQGNFAQADEAFSKALEYHADPPYKGELLYFQGMAALRLKDFPRATELLRTAIGTDLDRKLQTDASYNLAFAYDKMGERRTARDLYQRFYTQHERHPLAALAEKRFHQLSGHSGDADAAPAAQ
jgi:tetratricopeptide (TPR) repeat protein